MVLFAPVMHLLVYQKWNERLHLVFEQDGKLMVC